MEVMDKQDLNIKYETCYICGKSCGSLLKDQDLPRPQISHWECAFKICKEAREYVLKGKK